MHMYMIVFVGLIKWHLDFLYRNNKMKCIYFSAPNMDVTLCSLINIWLFDESKRDDKQ